jgi:DNA-binding IclR family transcriptional regulator
MTVLRAFGPDDVVLFLTELGRRTALSRATVYRLANHLAELDLLERTENGWRLGLELFTLEQVPRIRELRRVARPHLQELHAVVLETVHLAILQRRRLGCWKRPSRPSPTEAVSRQVALSA